MIQRHSIPNFKPLIVDSTIPEEQGCGIINGLPYPFPPQTCWTLDTCQGLKIALFYDV